MENDMSTYTASRQVTELVRLLDTAEPVHLGAEMLPTIIAAGDMGLVAFVPPQESPHTVRDPSAYGDDPHIAITKGQGTTFALLNYEPKQRS